MILHELINHGVSAKSSKCSNGAATVEQENQTEKVSIGGGVQAQNPNCSKSSNCSKVSMILNLEPKLKVDNNNIEKMKTVDSATATVATVATVGLPEICPLVTTGAVPEACRFHPKLFARFIAGGVLPTTDGCPILRVCELRQP